ncbi:MAG: [FeFe] hydrogenase H-cluster radical SAM maturase HydE [Acutalibacteraceae bacterium]|nr:[FeFe] hydrogenase H-cluster radical SAM maturase HydE [Acutalibacteraceae bacterium]
MNNFALIDKLAQNHSLSTHEYLTLLTTICDEEIAYLAKCARDVAQRIYGNKIFIRGLIEISNICKNDCYYCGIRKSNKNCERYRLSEDEILSCCDEGYALGFRTFVMQGGEDGYFTDERLCRILEKIKSKYSDCAVTLSLGERSLESYQKLKSAGADRYLLRHETATKEHYEKLHPRDLSFENRMECLKNLRKCGYRVGCGFMVGSPYQTTEMLVNDLKFIEHFKPDMCGIGPFIPHKDTDFCTHTAGSVDLTCILLSLIRLIHPPILLPATTALATLSENGREKGILSGANVVMPNLSPMNVRSKYLLYDNKIAVGTESAQQKEMLEKSLRRIGYTVVTDIGDINK